MNSSFLILLIGTTLIPGCTTKSKSQAQAKAAFMAGQRQAFAQVQEAQRTNIRVIGNVRNSEIEWTSGLTLAHAIVAAQSVDRRNPRQIVIVRQGERIPVDPHDLLQGDDFLLEPGDTIELTP